VAQTYRAHRGKKPPTPRPRDWKAERQSMAMLNTRERGQRIENTEARKEEALNHDEENSN